MNYPFDDLPPGVQMHRVDPDHAKSVMDFFGALDDQGESLRLSRAGSHQEAKT